MGLKLTAVQLSDLAALVKSERQPMQQAPGSCQGTIPDRGQLILNYLHHLLATSKQTGSPHPGASSPSPTHSESSHGSEPDPGASAPATSPQDRVLYVLDHEDYGAVGLILIDSTAGCGTRYLTTGGFSSTDSVVEHHRPSDTSSNMGMTEQPNGTEGGSTHQLLHLCRTAPVVVVGLQQGSAVASTGMSGPAFFVWQLLHEMGHALHFVLAPALYEQKRRVQNTDMHDKPAGSSVHMDSASTLASPSATPAPSQPSPLPAGAAADAASSSSHDLDISITFHTAATQLPLELIELPSTLFEKLAMQPHTLHQIMNPEGEAPC